MKDTVLRGTGNSRTLRGVPNFSTLYSTYNAFAKAMEQGTVSIDIGALNSAGLTTRGTDLNKANILTDATATGMGLTSSATPNQAFARLRALIKTAQDSADTALETGVSFMTGSYVGTGTSGEDNPTTIRLPRAWKMCVLGDRTRSNNNTVARGLFFSGSTNVIRFYYEGGSVIPVETMPMSESGNTLSFYSWRQDRGVTQFNVAGYTYDWWAI